MDLVDRMMLGQGGGGAMAKCVTSLKSQLRDPSSNLTLRCFET